MAAIVKELLHDVVKRRVDIDTRITLIMTIEQLYHAGVFSKQDVLLLEYYYRGYSAEEIAIKFFLSTETVTGILSRFLIAIETASEYTDETLLNKLAAKYTKRQLAYAKERMTMYSKDFTYESI